MQTATGDPLVGRVLEGRYRILSRLARGGMSTVYTALDQRLDREVAIKVMSAALSTDPAFADRFTREARVAARLSHLNAVSVYDQGTDDGHVFLVMELVNGRTLRDLIREQGALPPAQAVSIMEPVLAALAAAHRAGLVHRDVKPENILLSTDGAVKVADFGLARAIEADASSTRTGLMMGTVAYCPPEQIARGEADARSDVYSAGIVLFELLTGKPPYAGDSAMAVAYQHVNSDVPAPSSKNPAVPARLDELVRRATDREPSARPLDAGAMLAELHDVRTDLGLPVVGVPLKSRTGNLSDTQPLGDVRAAAGVAAAPRNISPDAHTIAHPIGLAGAAGTRAPQRAPGRGGSSGPSGPGGSTGSRARPSATQANARLRAKRRRNLWIAIALVLLLGLLTGYGAWWLVSGRYKSVPSISGLTQAAATQQLTKAGLKVQSAIDSQYSETVSAGTVITSHPDAGSHILPNKSVQLVVSKGPERYTVPDVRNQTLDAAQKLFAPLALSISTTSKSDTKVPENSVIDTDPVAGTSLKRNAKVTIIVSTGRQVVAVPDVRNKTLDNANTILTGLVLTVKTTNQTSMTVPSGTVIDQTPAADASARQGDMVTLTVSSGPPLVALPDVVGKSITDATKILTDLGFKVTVNKVFQVTNTIVQMNPKAGTPYAVGQTVTLTST